MNTPVQLDGQLQDEFNKMIGRLDQINQHLETNSQALKATTK